MRIVGVVLVIAATSGCVTQRSLALGQLASAVGKGGADLVVTTGLMYAAQTAPPTQSNNQNAGSALSVPWFEANANYGLTDQVALNAHMSPAGLQPGVKITLNRSLIANIALLPELGFGYASTGSVTNVSGSNGIQTATDPTSQTRFIFTLGLKLLISHRSGFYCGVGYDLYATRAATNGTIGSGGTVQLTQTIVTSLEHLIGAAVGFNVAVGMVSIRPELDFAIIPAISTSTSSGTASVGGSGGFGFAFLGGFGFALTTPPDRRDKGAEEDEKNVGSEGDEKTDEETPPPKEKPRDKEDDN